MSGLADRVGYSLLVQIIMECWNEIILLILLFIMAVGVQSDKTDELRKKVDIPLTKELIIFNGAAFVYALFHIIVVSLSKVTAPGAVATADFSVFMYYAVGEFQTVFFWQVLYKYVVKKHGGVRMKKAAFLILILQIPMLLMLAVTPFFKVLYHFNAKGEYVRNWGYEVWQVITIVTFIFISSVVVIGWRRIDSFLKKIIIVGAVFPLCGFIVSQIFGLNVNNIAVGISALLMFVIYEHNKTEITLRYGYELEKAKTELAESKLALEEAKSQTLMAQIQPHFINNSLMAIRSRCFDYPEVYDCLTDFSRYLRSNFEALGDTRLILFEQEMDNIEAYLSLEKMNYRDRLNVVYDIEIDDFMLPALSVQPLVENAVRHGIGTYDKGGTVTISSHRQGDSIVVEISDDGTGSKSESPQQRERRGIGINNVKKRLKSMAGGKLDMISKEQGTTARITLPDKTRLDEAEK